MSTLAPPAPSYTFYALQQNRFTWTLTDSTGNPVTGATVNATLYSDRQIQNTAAYPGTADSIFNNLVMTEAPALSGIYSVTIPATFNPPQPLVNFVVVVTALSGTSPIGTWSTKAVIVPAADSIDLVSLTDAKTWLGINLDNNDADGMLQILITGFSRYVLNRTSRDSFWASNYTEIIDGNGAQQLFLRNTPINSVASVQIGAYNAPQSTSITSPGWYIDAQRKSIVFRSLGYGWGGGRLVPYLTSPQWFTTGRGNIQVVYNAGYTYIPDDLYEAVMETIGVFYARKDWKDLASRALSVQGGSGTTLYRNWHLTPGVESVLDFYSRRAIT